MKKNIVLMCAVFFMLVGCSDGAGGATKKYEATVSGYQGDVTVEVAFSKKEIVGIAVIEHNESSVVMSRTVPILEDRIMAAQSPVVDSVSGATFTSYAIKEGVANAMKQNGQKVEVITFLTKGPKKDPVTLPDVVTEVVVVGGGPAGLSAAIAAKENGVQDVILIEKLDILSGNGKFDRNFYDVFNSEAQIANGVEDSVEQFIEDKAPQGDDSKRLQVWAEGTVGIDAWLRSFGAELDYNYGGRNHMRTIDEYAGEEIQDAMEAQARKLGVDIRLGTQGLDFIFDGDVVSGVTVRHDNESYSIMADAVVLATGGFSTNKELLEEYAPGYEVFVSSNQIGTTGDFVKVFEKYDFAVDRMDLIRVIPLIVLPSRDITNSGSGTIIVNADGKRFVNERNGELELALPIFEQDDVWMVVDSKKVADFANVRKQVGAGQFIIANTLEELAQKIKVNADNLVETIDVYNANALAQTEDEFGQVPERAILSEGPFYASLVSSAVHMTKGGVVADEKARVLYEDGDIVDGLFAGGEVTWQSGGYAQSVIFGRLAGEEAAKYVLAM